MTPIDVVKTRIQIDPTYKKLNILTGTRQVIATDGARGLLTGFGPTAVGYLVQGGAKFAGYGELNFIWNFIWLLKHQCRILEGSCPLALHEGSLK